MLIHRVLLVLNIILLLTGCSTQYDSHSTVNTNEIEFEYLYRGFTPIIGEQKNFHDVLGTKIITNKADWYSYCANFCTTAAVLEEPDFTHKYIIADSYLYGSRASENVARDIKSIFYDNNGIYVETIATSTPIYAINLSGIGHWFVNIVVVDIEDITNYTISADYYYLP